MSLRIRRGTEAQRTGATFDLGEVAWTTDTNKLYVGDGVNLGGKNILASSAGTGLVWNATTQRLDFNGNSIGIINVQADANPSLGGNLNLNSRSITGGGITINGNTGSITATQVSGTQIGVTTGDISTNQLVINTNNISSNTGFISVGKNASPTNLVITANTSLDVALRINGILSGTAGLQQLGPIIRTSSSKGTLDSPLVLGAGDSLGQINFQGLINAGSFGVFAADLASIKATVATAGDLISNIATGKLELIVLNGPDPALAKIATFDSVGVFKAPVFQLTTYASDLARTTAIPTPQAGMMVFMSAGTSPAVTNKAVIYNGTDWALLPG